jgi:hypothetical protein
MTTGRILLFLAALAVLLVGARASPLDAESCTKLLNEHGELEGAGVEADMAKGAEWAKVNLGLEKLQRIRRFIEVTEQLVFRCRQKSLVSLPAENEDQKDQDKDDDKDDAPRVPPSSAGDKTKGEGKTKTPPAATKKSTEPAKKAAVQPPSKTAPPPKSTTKPQPKQPPSTAKPPQTKPPEKANVPAKQPAGAKGERTPPTAAAKGAPKAKDDD